MTEPEWTARICHYLQKHCACMVKVEYAASRYQQSGFPDRWLCHTLWCGWLEFKGVDTAVQLNQRLCMEEIWKRQPCGVFVVRKGADGEQNRVEMYDGKLVALWGCPEQLLLALHEITMRTRVTGAEQLELMRQIAVDATLARIKK